MNEELNQVLKQVQKRFEGDRFAYLSGCRIQSVEDGQACCTMEINSNGRGYFYTGGLCLRSGRQLE